MGARAWMGTLGPWSGTMICLSVCSQRGMTHPKYIMLFISDPWSFYKNKGAQLKEGREYWQETWRTSLRKVLGNKLRHSFKD
jgi:hypothetical protein